MKWIISLLALLLAPPVAEAKQSRRSILITHTVRAVKRVSPAVISITATRVYKSPFLNLPLLFSKQKKHNRTQRYIGSGVIVTSSGYAITNEHVISRATSLTVRLSNGTTYAAKTVGADRKRDLAVIKIQTKQKLTPAVLGSSKKLLYGQTAIAIGQPFGLTHTVSRGVISALNRLVRYNGREFSDMIQTDAAINPGNSGGPLVNSLGEVIGINAAIHRGGPGIGFAIPVDFAKKAIKRILRKHRSKLAYLGLTVRGRPGKSGVLVTSIVSGGPADSAGIKTMDVILSLGRNQIRSLSDFIKYVRGVFPGSRIKVRILRHSTRRNEYVRVGRVTKQKARVLFERRLGIVLGSAPNGVVLKLLRVVGVAYRIGLRPGDVIQQVDQWNVRSMVDMNNVASKLHMDHGCSLLFMIQRGLRTYFVTVPY